ncbi:dynein axonemal assembly factor 10-like isoform X2 [Diabrotica undecimpunctata]|uniref:dynein axonemal assembly factor 10-like isoform X2 n=1 Tax=Diabrotica undecimpunctata TaxID=50387 RepID=UPI003B63246B
MEALQRPQIICHNQKNVDYSVHDVKWIPCSAKFVTLGGKSNGSGIIEVYSLTSENVEKIHEFGKKEHFKCGTVMVWDVRQKDTPVAKFVPSAEASARDCWSVAFGNSYNNEERVVAAGYDNGDIKLFDLKTMSLRWSKCLKNGVVGIQFDRKNIAMNKLVATTLESKIFCYDVKTKHHKKGFACVTEKAHSSTVWTVKHLPQNRDIFMTTGGAGSLCLWKYTYPDKRVEKDADGIPYGIPGEISCLQNSTLSDQPITSFDWCVDKQGLAVCSAFDQTIRVLIVTKLNLY